MEQEMLGASESPLETMKHSGSVTVEKFAAVDEMTDEDFSEEASQIGQLRAPMSTYWQDESGEQSAEEAEPETLTRSEAEQSLREMFSLPLDQMEAKGGLAEYMNDVVMERVGQYEKSPSFRRLIEGHAKLLQHKSESTAFDLYGDQLEDDDSEESFNLFDDEDFDVEIGIAEGVGSKGAKKASGGRNVAESETLQTRFDRLEKKLRDMVVSNHGPTSKFALSILSSSEFQFLSESSAREQAEQEEQIQRLLEDIMRRVEDGEHDAETPAERKSLSVNELINEETMLELLGRDVVSELEKVLRNGVLARSLDEIESNAVQLDTEVTDLLHSYFFVGGPVEGS